jgi:molybdate transport system substrate-binding protein
MARTIRSVVVAFAFIASASACNKAPPSQDAAIKVAAASDLAFAFEEVGRAFTAKTGKQVTFTFGSTGQLAKQISEGAPYDLFAAANVSFVDEVVATGACDPATKAMYARGRIVVWSKKSGGVVPPAALADLTAGRFVKIALANPEHAPYGRAAKQALEKAGLWETLRPKIVYGENIQQALQFAQTGNTEVALAALSLATVNDDGTYVVVDDALHAPLDQALVVCKHGVNAKVATELAMFVNSEDGRAIMKRFGFLLPGETAVASTPDR